MRTAFGVDEQTVFFGIGRTGQDHIGAMCAATPVAALINHKGPLTDLDFISTEVIDNVRFVDRVHAMIVHSIHIHGPNARRRRMKHQQLGIASGRNFLRHGQHGRTISLLQGTLSEDHNRIAVTDMI